jgi:hypothetical protein
MEVVGELEEVEEEVEEEVDGEVVGDGKIRQRGSCQSSLCPLRGL